MNETVQELREKADYIEWLKEPLIQLTKLLHNQFCTYNHTDGCSFGYEENWKKVIDTTKHSGTAHARWYEKAFALQALLNGALLKIAKKIEEYPFESEGGNLKLCVDWQTLKTFLEQGKIE